MNQLAYEVLFEYPHCIASFILYYYLTDTFRMYENTTVRLVTTPRQNSNPKTTEEDIQIKSGISGVISSGKSMLSVAKMYKVFSLF